jgi:3-deoxy-7-phosphoheptulonate synthase
MDESRVHADPHKDDPAKLDFGRSITDTGLGWEDSVGVLPERLAAVKASRRHTR